MEIYAAWIIVVLGWAFVVAPGLAAMIGCDIKPYWKTVLVSNAFFLVCAAIIVVFVALIWAVNTLAIHYG